MPPGTGTKNIQKDLKNSKLTVRKKGVKIKALKKQQKIMPDFTLKDIAEIIKSSIKESTATLEAKIEDETEKLATISQKQFLQLDEKLSKVEKRLDNIESELNKKVDKIDHNTLKYRVEKLEKQIA